MDRKELKHDKFVEEVGHTVDFLSAHKSQVRLYGAIAAVLVVAGIGYYFYSSSQTTKRQQALAAALEVEDATVGQPQPPLKTFATQQEKEAARAKAFQEVATKYHGTQEGSVAAMYLAAAAMDEGRLADAERQYKDIVDSAPKPYASVAMIALADAYAGEGKEADAEKLLRELVDHPTVFVSKDEATIHLAQLIAKTKPAEARKLLDPLRTARSAVSRAAITTLGSIPQNN